MVTISSPLIFSILRWIDFLWSSSIKQLSFKENRPLSSAWIISSAISLLSWDKMIASFAFCVRATTWDFSSDDFSIIVLKSATVRFSLFFRAFSCSIASFLSVVSSPLHQKSISTSSSCTPSSISNASLTSSWASHVAKRLLLEPIATLRYSFHSFSNSSSLILSSIASCQTICEFAMEDSKTLLLKFISLRVNFWTNLSYSFGKNFTWL